MDEEIKECWWELIYILADELKKEKIVYHFDSSTSLFVHGIDFNMDDIDITVQWDCFEKVHKHFERYNVNSIKKAAHHELHFNINCFKIHVISSESSSDLQKDKDRVMLSRDGYTLWSKTPSSYRSRITLDHPLADLVDVYMQKNNL